MRQFIAEVLCIVIQSCLALCNPVDCSPPGSTVHGDSPGKNWSGLPCPPPGDLPDPGIEPRCPAYQADSYHLSHQGSPKVYNINSLFSKYLRNYMPRTDLSTQDTVVGRGGLCQAEDIDRDIRVKVVCHCGFVSLMLNTCSCASWPFVCLWKKRVFRASAHFLIEFFVVPELYE